MYGRARDGRYEGGFGSTEDFHLDEVGDVEVVGTKIVSIFREKNDLKSFRYPVGTGFVLGSDTVFFIWTGTQDALCHDGSNREAIISLGSAPTAINMREASATGLSDLFPNPYSSHSHGITANFAIHRTVVNILSPFMPRQMNPKETKARLKFAEMTLLDTAGRIF
jgi:hypothetical protein